MTEGRRSKHPKTQRLREWRAMEMPKLRQTIREQKQKIIALEINYRGTSELGSNKRRARGKEESAYMPDLGTEKKELARMLTVLRERQRKGEKIPQPKKGG